MSTLLPPETTRFELRDGAPVITLDTGVPEDVTAGAWSLINRLTLVLVDGPGDDGFMLPRFGADGDLAPAGWDDAVDRATGSHVVFGTASDAPSTFAHSLGAGLGLGLG